jgi:pyruvate,water dikinase
MDTITWDPPGPGPWQQDSAHNPVSQTALMQEVYPEGFNKGFTEAFAGHGLLLDRLAMGVVNGFTYHQPQPFDMPGPDGPKDPEWIGAEIGRRTENMADAEPPFELHTDQLEAILSGSAGPGNDELQRRRDHRLRLTLDGPPRYLGPPPPDPPPLEMLPPPMARVMAAVGFAIDGILGQLDEPAGISTSIAGIAGSAGVHEGTARLVKSIDDLLTLEPGDVLVAPTTGEAFNSMLHLVGAIVTDHGSFASHAAIVSREMGIPSVVGTVNATTRIEDGARVRVDGSTGTVDIL